MRKKILIVFLLAICKTVISDAKTVNEFSFEKHWRFPLESQGEPPDFFSDLEASLNPDDCGLCHKTQYLDWKKSLHSQAMGVGITSQLHAPWLDDEGQYSCLYCHAPLAEQSPFIKTDNVLKKNKLFDPKLKTRGLTCAGCHMRRYVRYGPKPLSGKKLQNAPHNSFVEVENFGDSKFCKPCHQFNHDDNRVNGKLLQNTYEEWKKSPYFSKGIHCTGCHMPGRRHMWQGIHSVEMVKKGVTIRSEKKGEKIFVEIENSGVGHNFPTYVTPKVVIKTFLIDKNGKEIKGSSEEKYIGRDIKLDLSEELYDTRIPPGDIFKTVFSPKGTYKAKKIKLEIKIYPDDFYSRFFKSLIDNKVAGVDIKEMKKALKKSKKAAYTLYEKHWDVQYKKKIFDYIREIFE